MLEIKLRYNETYNFGDDSIKEKIGDVAKDYLEDLLEYCKKNELNVLFMLSPHVLSNTKSDLSVYHKINYCKELINEYGYELINYSTNIEQYDLNGNGDFYDNGHLNAIGQRKFTTILVEEILKRIEIKEKNISISKVWDENYIYYEEVYNDAKQQLALLD